MSDFWLQKYKEYKMSSEEKEEQLISFVYGNVKLSNPNITKEDIKKAVETLRNQ